MITKVMPLHTPTRIDIGARGAVLLYYARIYTAVRQPIPAMRTYVPNFFRRRGSDFIVRVGF
jgi:hypothetical protein